MIHPVQVRPIIIGNDALYGPGLQFHPGQLANGHLNVTGSSGMGKSSIVRHVANSLHCLMVPLVILDFHGDLAIPVLRTMRLGDGSAGECSIRFLEPTPLALKAFGLRGCLENAVSAIEEMGRRKLGEGQANSLRSTILELWRSRGVKEVDGDFSTSEANSIFPSDLLKLLLEKKEEAATSREKLIFEGLISRIDALATCAIFEHEVPLRIGDILQKGARLHMQGIPAPMRGPVARALVSMMFAEITAMGPIKRCPLDAGATFRVYFVIDEAGSVIRKKADDCIIKTIAKESRKFGVGLILAAQTLDELSEEVVANVDTHIALPTKSPKDARKVEQKLNLRRGALSLGAGRCSGYYQSGFQLFRANFYYLK